LISGSDDDGNSHLRSSRQTKGQSLRGRPSETGERIANAPVDYRFEAFIHLDVLLHDRYSQRLSDLSGRELTHTRGLAQTFVAVMTLNLSKNSISIIGALPVGLRVLDISCNIL